MTFIPAESYEEVLNDKRERFDVSVAKTFMVKALGLHRKEVELKMKALADGFGCAWLNQAYDPNEWIWASRVLKYNFDEIILGPKSKHPILVAYEDFCDNNRQKPCAMVFKHCTMGNLVIRETTREVNYMPVTLFNCGDKLYAVSSFNAYLEYIQVTRD